MFKIIKQFWCGIRGHSYDIYEIPMPFTNNKTGNFIGKIKYKCIYCGEYKPTSDKEA